MQSSKKILIAVQNNAKMEDREFIERASGIEYKKNRAERRLQKRLKNRK